jgi:hypothetical protein
MLAQDTYEATAPGHTGTIRFSGKTDDVEAWEDFAVEVRVIEHMVRQGLLTVSFRHVESQTGRRHVDMVTFTRL